MEACKMKKPFGEKWGCCALIVNPENPEQFLVCRRALSEHQEPGSWGFSGGKVESNERPFDAVRREVREETGLNLTNCKYIGSFKEKNYTDFIFLSDLWSGEIVLDQTECSDYSWATLDDLKEQRVGEDSVAIFSFTKATVTFYEEWLSRFGHNSRKRGC